MCDKVNEIKMDKIKDLKQSFRHYADNAKHAQQMGDRESYDFWRFKAALVLQELKSNR